MQRRGRVHETQLRDWRARWRIDGDAVVRARRTSHFAASIGSAACRLAIVSERRSSSARLIVGRFTYPLNVIVKRGPSRSAHPRPRTRPRAPCERENPARRMPAPAKAGVMKFLSWPAGSRPTSADAMATTPPIPFSRFYRMQFGKFAMRRFELPGATTGRPCSIEMFRETDRDRAVGLNRSIPEGKWWNGLGSAIDAARTESRLR